MLDSLRKEELAAMFYNNEEPRDSFNLEEKKYWNLLLLDTEKATLKLLERIVAADQQLERSQDG